MQDAKDQEKKTIIVPMNPIGVKVSAPDLTVWLADSFAEDWFVDALTEARRGSDIHSIRRQIVLACCFAESFIFEWTRRQLQIDEIETYFPTKQGNPRNPKFRRSLVVKWKHLPGELFEAGKISRVPKLNLNDLRRVAKLRNGLVHASGSRLKTKIQPTETVPFPTKEDLARLSPGWAVRIVANLVLALHRELQVEPPSYIELP